MDFTGSGLLYFIISLLIAISIHEMMHAFTAHRLGDTTASDMGRVTLNPLAHIDLLTTIILPIVLVLLHLPPILAAKPVPFNPDRVRFEEFGAALVGLAGPLTNLVLAVVSAVAYGALSPDPGSHLSGFFQTFINLNVALFVFNMLPIPPLDGSRVLYAFAPEPVQRLMAQIEQFGLIAILAILFLLGPTFLFPIISDLNTYILNLLV